MLTFAAMGDITTMDDVQLLVNTFYQKVQADEILSPVFALRIEEARWPEHLEKMYRFWGSILLYTQNYQGSPFDKHIGLPIDGTHFAQWMKLFTETVDELFSGEVANIAKERAANIARIFEFKLASLKPVP